MLRHMKKWQANFVIGLFLTIICWQAYGMGGNLPELFSRAPEIIETLIGAWHLASQVSDRIDNMNYGGHMYEQEQCNEQAERNGATYQEYIEVQQQTNPCAHFLTQDIPSFADRFAQEMQSRIDSPAQGQLAEKTSLETQSDVENSKVDDISMEVSSAEVKEVAAERANTAEDSKHYDRADLSSEQFYEANNKWQDLGDNYGYSYNNSEQTYSSDQNRRSHVHQNQEAYFARREYIIEKIISGSTDLEAIKVQINITKGNFDSSLNRILEEHDKVNLQKFFWKNGDFNLIYSSEQKEELLYILIPAIKKHFLNDHYAYLNYARKQAAQGKPGFREWEEYETHQSTFQDKFFFAGDWIYNSVDRLVHSVPTTEQVENCLFVKQLNEVVRLCKEGNEQQALDLIQGLVKNINKLDQDERRALECRYNCLINMFNDCIAQNRSSIKKAALLKAFEQQAALKSSEVPSANQLPANSGGGMTPGDPEKDKEKLAELMEPDKTNLKETKIYRDAEQQIASNTKRFEMLDLKPISQGKLKHIVNKHTNVGEIARQRNMGNKGSIFNDDINLIELILDAYEFGTEIAEGTKIYDSGKIIGIHDKKGPTTIVIVGFDKIEKIIKTAFPG